MNADGTETVYVDAENGFLHSAVSGINLAFDGLSAAIPYYDCTYLVMVIDFGESKNVKSIHIRRYYDNRAYYGEKIEYIGYGSGGQWVTYWDSNNQGYWKILMGMDF